MNLRQLKLFLAIIDAGGFTAAAERLGLAQPAVSAALRKLEDDLGVQLLARGPHRLTLTAIGTAFLRHAHAILEQVAASRREIAAMRTLEVGHVSIGATAIVVGHLLPRVIDGFLIQWPGLHLTIAQAGTEEIQQRVLRGELDIGVIAAGPTPDGLSTELLKLFPLVACVATFSPLAGRQRLTWAEFLDEPLILFPRSYLHRLRVEEAAANLGRSPRVVAEVEAVPLIVELVRRGHGMATLMAAVAERLPDIRILSLPSEATVPITICRRVKAPGNPAVEAFHAYLVQHADDLGPRAGD